MPKHIIYSYINLGSVLIITGVILKPKPCKKNTFIGAWIYEYEFTEYRYTRNGIHLLFIFLKKSHNLTGFINFENCFRFDESGNLVYFASLKEKMLV